MKTVETKNLYSVSEAAKYLHMTPQGVHYLINVGKLKTINLNGKYKYVEKEELEKRL